MTTQPKPKSNIAWDNADPEDSFQLYRKWFYRLLRANTEIAGEKPKAKPKTKSQKIQIQKTKLDNAKADMKYAQARKTQGAHFKPNSSLNPKKIQERIKHYQEALKAIQNQNQKPKATIMTSQAILGLELAAEQLEPLEALEHAANKGRPCRAIFNDGDDLLLSPYLARKVMSMLSEVTQATFDRIIPWLSASVHNYLQVQHKALYLGEEDPNESEGD